jgi:hypothetical protein
MNPVADHALVAFAVAASILALVSRKLPRLGSGKTATRSCAGQCGCVQQADSFTRTLANTRVKSAPKTPKSNGNEA